MGMVWRGRGRFWGIEVDFLSWCGDEMAIRSSARLEHVFGFCHPRTSVLNMCSMYGISAFFRTRSIKYYMMRFTKLNTDRM